MTTSERKFPNHCSTYNPHRQLWRQACDGAGANETTTYVGELVEKVSKSGVTTWKHYVEAPTGTAAVYLRRSDGTADTYYLTHDHLGSTDKVLNAAGGVVTVEESFTAFGARRGSDWQGTPTSAELAAIAASTRDGFTGHAMLDAVGLIHMRGRVYDPVLGRFLSVDPLVRDVTATQSWNGYGYVEGRALSATDPSGYKLEIRVIDGVETIIGTESRLHLSCIICDVDIGQDSRFRLQSSDLIAQLGGPSGLADFAAEVEAPQTPSPLGETSCPAPMTFAQDMAIRRSLVEINSGGSYQESVTSSLGRNATTGALIVGGALGAGGAAVGGYYGVAESVRHALHFPTATRIVLGTMSIAEGAAAGAAAGGTLGLGWGTVVGAVVGVVATPIINWASSPELGLFEREDAWLEANCPQSVFRP